MNVAVRPYATAGIALVGASVIAVSPLAPPMPNGQAVQRTVSSIGVELSASVNPIDNWIQVFQKSSANLAALGEQFAASPAPILQQILVNQAAALKDLQTRFDSNATTLRQILNSIPSELEAARALLDQGDITGAFSKINNDVVIPLALSGVQALSDLTQPAVATVNNFAKAFAAVPNAVFQVVLPMTFPLLSTINVFVQTAQDVYDGAAASDPAAILNALVNLPANLVGGFLNGSGQILGFIDTPGLLTPYGDLGFLGSGPIASLLDLRNVIAQAIGAAPPSAAAAAAKKVPAAAKTVTLTTEAPKAVGAGSAVDAPKADESTVTDAVESSTGSTGSTTVSTKATPAVTAAPATDSATGGSSSSDAKSGAGHDSKAGSAKKGATAKSGRAAKASK